MDFDRTSSSQCLGKAMFGQEGRNLEAIEDSIAIRVDARQHRIDNVLLI
jgi:hypothetical protein